MWLVAVSVAGVMMFMLLGLAGVSADVITESLVLSAFVYGVLFWLMAELDWVKCEGE